MIERIAELQPLIWPTIRHLGLLGVGLETGWWLTQGKGQDGATTIIRKVAAVVALSFGGLEMYGGHYDVGSFLLGLGMALYASPPSWLEGEGATLTRGLW